MVDVVQISNNENEQSPSPAVHLQTLFDELDWLSSVINTAIESYFAPDVHGKEGIELTPPDLCNSNSAYSNFVKIWRLSSFERLTLALAIAPQLRPQSLDIFQMRNCNIEHAFSAFGGYTDQRLNSFLPTGQTLAFLLSANDPLRLTEAFNVLSPTHLFSTQNVINPRSSDEKLPMMATPLLLSENWLRFFLTGEKVHPEFDRRLSSSPLTTPLEWNDLVLDEITIKGVEEIRLWSQHSSTLMQEWGLNKKIKPGFRTLFYGPPGTGKTLCATLLGKMTATTVYRLDLSIILSATIEEIGNSLDSFFDVAANKNWILFFDEADALLGKSGLAAPSSEKNKNQQIGFLLQRIEDFPGIVILAASNKVNIDDSLRGNFQSVVQFMMPNSMQRLLLWQNAFAGVCDLAPEINLKKISQDYVLTGGAIINVLRYCALQTMKFQRKLVCLEDLLDGIDRELSKTNGR